MRTEEFEQEFVAVFQRDDALVIGTEATEIVLTGDLDAFIDRVRSAASLIDSDERECSRCGDSVQTLNSQDECMGCEEARANGNVCSRCDEDVDWSDMHAYKTKKGKTVCGSCAHDERRSG